MRSVELTFDPATEAAIRRWWDVLVAEGLPSLALHDAPSNRPHVTLVAGPTLVPAPRLPSVSGDHPADVRFGDLVTFPASRGRSVLARSVVVDPVLAAFQERVHAAVSGEAMDHTAPREWTPHVTIARRLPPEALERATEVLAACPVPTPAVVGEVRFWDGDTRTLTRLA
jgi:hypothetical protein